MPKAAAQIEFALRPMRDGERFGALKHGEEEFLALKIFAKQKAAKFEAANLARTYVFEDKTVGKVAAYVTLTCSEVVSENRLLEAEVAFPYKNYPAVKIARLLVGSDYRGTGYRLGTALVDFTVGIARSEICPAVGCRFVVVDAKKASVSFYEACGFTLIDTDENKARDTPVLFMDLHKAAA
ncbi:GNAT family N-acetyltransferase [uncultured Brevundimonas sp.]|uniref:GNAT family N-acetyltransferase n=1 Tax=uncultured Brevundimonas sp. TaxID=213418 RepID=UPI0030ED7395